MISGSSFVEVFDYERVGMPLEIIDDFLGRVSAFIALETIPRISIAPLATPVERCERLESAISGMPELLHQTG
jgi:hypothetical protein